MNSTNTEMCADVDVIITQQIEYKTVSSSPVIGLQARLNDFVNFFVLFIL